MTPDEIFAIDNGYEDTKIIGNGIRRIFRSSITTTGLIAGTAHIIIDGVGYCVGTGNKMVSKPDKTNHEVNKVCSLTALAMYGSGERYLVVGLPIGQYKTQKEKFKEIILNYNNSKIIYHNKQLDIKIKHVTVYPQGAAVIYALNRMYGEYIIFDVGAFTIDVALIEMANGSPTILKYDTWFKGISTLYSVIIDVVNNKYNITLEPQDAEQILVQEYLRVDGENVDISFVDDIINNYLEEIYCLFDKYYKSRTTDIYLCGGGAEIIYNKFKNNYKQTELVNDPQFANARGYYQIGLQKYYNSLVESRC